MVHEFSLLLSLVGWIGAASLHVQCLNGLFVHNGQCLTRWQICDNSSLYNEETEECDPCMKGYYVAEGSFYCTVINQMRPEDKLTSASVPITEATPITEQPETTPTPRTTNPVLVDNVTLDSNSEVKAHDNETLSNVTDTMVTKSTSDKVTLPTKPVKENGGFPGWAVAVIIIVVFVAICIIVVLVVFFFRKSIQAFLNNLRMNMLRASGDSGTMDDGAHSTSSMSDLNSVAQESDPLNGGSDP